MSSNEWFGKFKSKAKSVQETAKNRLEKFSETIDKKLKEAQDDLEKQRSKTESPDPISPHLQRWRPSSDNPDGEIVAEVKPPPPIEQPVITPPPESAPEPEPTPVVEPITIPRMKKKRRAGTHNNLSSTLSVHLEQETDSTNEEKPSSIQQKYHPEEVVPYLTNTNNQTIDRESLDKYSNELNDKITTSDELVDNTTLSTIPVQDSTSYIEKEESTASKIELYQDNIQVDVPEDELLPMTNTDNLPIEHSGLENIPIKITNDEPPILTNIGDSSIERSGSESLPIDITNDELPTVTQIDDSTTEHSDPEDIPTKIPDNEIPTVTKIDDSTTEHSDPEDIPIKIPDNETPALTNIEELPTEHSSPQNIQMKIPDDELPTLTDAEDPPINHFSPDTTTVDVLDDELSTSTKIDNSPKADLNQENIPMSESNDELPTLTKTEDSPTEYFNPENISINVLDDEPPTLTDTDDASLTYSDPKNILMNIPDDDLPTITDMDNTSLTYTAPKNILMSIPDDELPTITDMDNTSMAYTAPKNIMMNIPDDELPTIVDLADSSIDNSDAENLLIKIPDAELPTLPNMNDIPAAPTKSEQILLSIPDNNLPVIKPDPKRISINESDDELPPIIITNNTPAEDSDSEDEFLMLPSVIKSPIKHPDSNEKYTFISKNNIKTPPNELEDSFDELKIPNISVQRPPEKPPQELTHLAALRAFISKIEDDGVDDEEPISIKQQTIIIDKNINPTSEQTTTSNLLKTTLSLSSTSISNDTLENLVNETLVQSNSLSDEPSIDEINENVSTVSIESKPIEKKRFPVVNCHSIPPGTKIYHINCSSTYIYLCTIDRKIFYAKLNLNDIDYPFKWQQHTDLAERIVASHSNQTVWRLYNKHLYASHDPIKYPPFGSQWNEIKIDNKQSLLSMSVNDQCGWYIKEDGSLWLIRMNDHSFETMNVTCPFNLNTVFCFSEKVGVTTSDGEILIRVGCTNDCLEGDGWIFIEHNFGPIDDFILLTNNNIISIIDKKHQLWIHQWSSEKGFYQILCNDEFGMSHQRYLVTVNSEVLCFTDCEEQIHIFSDCLTGVQWTVVESNTRLQRLIGAFSNEDFVWALTTDKMISSSNGLTLEKPRQAQYLTHATFVPHNSSQNTVLWSLDESCNIYVRANVENDLQWEQVDQSQFEWNRRLLHIACNHAGVWAVDDKGDIHFRHGHISASQNIYSAELAFLPPAWISIPGEPKKYRCFSQIFCGPVDWMVYATDNKQNVYTRDGINEENRIGAAWKAIEDCSALELAISEHTLWLLTSHGEIQCRENISLTSPAGTRSTTLPGFFRSLTVSVDDNQVWALDSQRNLLKLDRLTVLFEK